MDQSVLNLGLRLMRTVTTRQVFHGALGGRRYLFTYLDVPPDVIANFQEAVHTNTTTWWRDLKATDVA